MTPELFVAIIVCILVVIFGQPLLALLIDYGVPLVRATRRRYVRVEWPVIMSRVADEDADAESNEEPAFSPATTTPQPATTALQSGATDSNALLLGQARALAAMVKAGKIGETEGIKLVFGVAPSSTNPRYQAARAALKEELAKLEPAKFHRTPEQEAAREALGLSRN